MRGTVAYLPTDGALVPDWLSATARTLAARRGARSAGWSARAPLPTSSGSGPSRARHGARWRELADVALATSGGDVAGIVAAAEAAELTTAVLRRSPARPMRRAARIRGRRVREWLAFSPERTPARRAVAHRRRRRATAARAALAGFLRPLGAIRRRSSATSTRWSSPTGRSRSAPCRCARWWRSCSRASRSGRRATSCSTTGDRERRRERLLRGLCWTAPITTWRPGVNLLDRRAHDRPDALAARAGRLHHLSRLRHARPHRRRGVRRGRGHGGGAARHMAGPRGRPPRSARGPA